MVWEKYVKYRAQQDNGGELPLDVNLRSKESGWSRYRYSSVFAYANGNRSVISSNESLYMRMFVGDFICRSSCEKCNFKGYSRCSDLTIGDFWGIWDIMPDMDDNKGTSVLLFQSQKGQRLFEQISDRCTVAEVFLEQASRKNPSMLYSSAVSTKRKNVFSAVRNGDFADCRDIVATAKPVLMQRVKRWIRRILER